jgi:hypothetical protein
LPHPKTNNRLQSGAALITALILVVIISSMVGASLMYSQQHHTLAYVNVRSESALLLAEGGVNDELQYIATNLASSAITGLSSQPVAGSGETERYPGENFTIKGRKSTVDGQPGEYFWVYSSNDRDGTIPWDGRQFTFWITSSAKVDGSWRRVRVQTSANSIFGLYAIFALASYGNNSNSVQMSAATVNVVGIGGMNGTLTGGNSSITVSTALNANTSAVSTGQFTSSNVASGGSLITQAAPVIYPSVSTVLKRLKGRNGDTDAQAWTWLSTGANNSNNTGIYTYSSHPSSTTLSTANCRALNLGITSLFNSAGNTKGNWSTAGYKPSSYLTGTGFAITGASNTSPIEITTSANHGFSTGDSVCITGVTGNTAANGNWTVTKSAAKKFTLNSSVGNGAGSAGTAYPNVIRTLIFEPGDYYFTSVNLGFDYATQIVMDPQAHASGGTPGQIRFWIYDPANGTQNDTMALPITSTLASGELVADPANFRLYYAKDNKTFSFQRPSGVTYLNESTHTIDALNGDFDVYGGVYAVTRVVNDSSTSSLSGTNIDFTGTSSGGGQIVLRGSLLADKLSFHGPCSVVYINSVSPNDPVSGGGVSGGYSDGS